MGDGINERAALIRADEAAAARARKKAEVAANQEAARRAAERERAREAKARLARKFAMWALANKISLDRPAHRDVRGPLARLRGERPRTRKHGEPSPAGWVLVDIGSDTWEKSECWHITVIVTPSGDIAVLRRNHGPSGALLRGLDAFTLEALKDGVARRVADTPEAKVPWT